MKEKKESKYGDLRIDKACVKILDRIVIRFTTVIRQLGDNHKERSQFYRLINNDKVTPDKILEHYWEESSLDFSSRHILVINDSSTLSYSQSKKREELGYVGRNTNIEGFNIHPSIFVDAKDRSFYGIGGITFYKNEKSKTKDDEEKRREKRKNRWKIPFEEKERYKWLESPLKAIKNKECAKRYTIIGDRESDIYDLMAKVQKQGWDFLFRNKADRLIDDGISTTLYKEMQGWENKHSYEFEVKETKKRTSHKAKMDIKYGEVNVRKPRNNVDKQLVDQISMNVIEVKERPESVIKDEEAIHWILLTSHRIETLEDALQIISWYQTRWVIEQLFRTIKKQGLQIEKSEIETYTGLQKLSVLALIAAAQVMQLVQARGGQTDDNIDSVFFKKEQKCLYGINKKIEGKTQKLKNPYSPDTVAYASWIIARLGGWSGYKNQRAPGPITICRGLIRFYDILEGYYLFLDES